MFCSDSEIKKLNNKTVVLVLKEAAPIPHILVKYPIASGIQIIDIKDYRNIGLNNYRNVKPSEFESEKRPALLISTQTIETGNQFFIYFGIFFCFFLVTALGVNKLIKSLKK